MADENAPRPTPYTLAELAQQYQAAAGGKDYPWVAMFGCGCTIQGEVFTSCGRHATPPAELTEDVARHALGLQRTTMHCARAVFDPRCTDARDCYCLKGEDC